MYAITARYHGPTDHQGGRFAVRCSHKRTVQGFAHERRDPAETAIRAHVDSCDRCSRLAYVDGYRPVLATLPTASGRDGDTVAVWTVRS